MKAEIIAVGTEILTGQIVNTNAQFLSEKLAEIGVDVYFQTAVGDNEARLLSIANIGSCPAFATEETVTIFSLIAEAPRGSERSSERESQSSRFFTEPGIEKL